MTLWSKENRGSQRALFKQGFCIAAGKPVESDQRPRSRSMRMISSRPGLEAMQRDTTIYLLAISVLLLARRDRRLDPVSAGRNRGRLARLRSTLPEPVRARGRPPVRESLGVAARRRRATQPFPPPEKYDGLYPVRLDWIRPPGTPWGYPGSFFPYPSYPVKLGNF